MPPLTNIERPYWLRQSEKDFEPAGALVVDYPFDDLDDLDIPDEDD